MKKNYLIIVLLSLFSLGTKAQVAIDFSKYEGLQIINSDFEDWSGEEFKNVPVGWHSFESVGGTMASTAHSTKHTSVEKEDLHNGTIGKACLKLVPRNVLFGIIANGTITTGRMNAGSPVATDPLNHAWMDITNTETSNGSPFYAKLSKKPIALSVWVKFTQGTAQPEHPYATVSAAITNGNRYQEPTADKDSSMVIGYAKNNMISSNGGQWQHLYLPFNYDSKNYNKTDDPKAIMVTFSTNADPGKGSVGDVLLIDDLELIYSQLVTIPECGYATLTNISQENHNVIIPEGITAYTIGVKASGELMVKDVFKAGQVLPYHAAVLLEGKPGEYEFKTTLYEKEVTIDTEGDACMVKGIEYNAQVDGYKYYRLLANNNVLGFYPTGNGDKIKPQEALLRVKSEMAEN
ncbi:MAG: PCMD domain-containing protein, partial [Prevotella sp.]|nr:PCMD domain-containing protein [Prevotella sp.]